MTAELAKGHPLDSRPRESSGNELPRAESKSLSGALRSEKTREHAHYFCLPAEKAEIVDWVADDAV